ncbi:unnamed protein product [Cunninghamella echinulata]
MTNHSLTQKNMTNYNIVLPTPSASKLNNNNNHSKAGPKSLVKEPQHHNNKPSKPKSKKQQPSPFNEKQELAVVTNNNNKQVKKKVKSQQQQQPSSHVMNNNNNKIQQQQQQKPHHHQHHQQQRRNVMPVKIRRVERRKEIVSMTEALHTSQVDLLSASPPVSSSFLMNLLMILIQVEWNKSLLKRSLIFLALLLSLPWLRKGINLFIYIFIFI